MNKIKNYLIEQYKKLPFNPFSKLFNRIFNFYLFIIKRKIYKNRKLIAKIDGVNFQLELNEMIDSDLFFLGYYDYDTTNAINRLCKEGMIALDIGANIGVYTFRMAKLVGKTGKVIAFEPMSWAFLKLKKNFELNNFHNITLEKLALTNKQKKENTFFKSSWSTDGVLKDIAQKKELIEFTTLDEHLREKGINKVDFIKIDVDGYEYRVLQGAINTLKIFKPIIILELDNYTLRRSGTNIEAVISFLSNLGYKFYSEKNFREYNKINMLKNSIKKYSKIDVILSAKPL